MAQRLGFSTHAVPHTLEHHSLGWSLRQNLDEHRASFETRPSGAPQDEVFFLMPS